MINDKIFWYPKWKIDKYKDDDDFQNGIISETKKFDGNLLLNEGITELLNLLIGGTATAFNNLNSYIGIGDDSTAATPTQTDLVSVTNKAYAPMDTGYPTVVGQTVTFKATFGSAVANWNWQEITVANGSSGTAKNLNRKIQSMGTKISPATWSVTCTITIS